MINQQEDSTNFSQQLSLQKQMQNSFANNNFQKVLQLVKEYQLLKYGLTKDICILQARSFSQLGNPQECLQSINQAVKLGANGKDIFILKMRSYIELNQIKEAEIQLSKIMKEEQSSKKLIQLYNALDIIKDKFDSYSLPSKENQILDALIAWLREAGGTFPKLKVVNLKKAYRGVVATKHIKKGQKIVFIPKTELISLEMAKKTKIVQNLIEKKVKLQSPKHSYLSILLLQLKNTPNSKFKPYIDLLPADHSCFPINFTTNQLQLLQGSPFLNMIHQKVLDLKRDYDNICKSDQNFLKYKFKQFCWARMMIGSRIFGLIISGVKTQVLVPFADMLNHRQPKQTVWNYDESLNGFTIESSEEIQVGQQVFDSYGRKCNSRFLLNYGFILDENPDNQIAIRIELPENDPLTLMKKNMIHENENEPFVEIKKISSNLNSNKFYQLMGCLRFICVNEQQSLVMLKKISNIQVTKQAYVMVRTPPISLKNQTLSWQRLGSLCQKQLLKYRSNIEEDMKILRQKKLTQNEYNIIKLRLGQKILLTQMKNICKEVVQILQSTKIIEALQMKVQQKFARYLYKILTLTPGINKKSIEKKLSRYFSTQNDVTQEEVEQVPES